jgi:TrmH family RNA methyltransferase
MGSLFAVDLVRTSSRALAGWKSRRDVRIVGASSHARVDYKEADYSKPLVLMMGSERTGLRDRQTALCDQLVRLPMTGKVDSLNLATATSVLLYEALRHGSKSS